MHMRPHHLFSCATFGAWFSYLFVTLYKASAVREENSLSGLSDPDFQQTKDVYWGGPEHPFAVEPGFDVSDLGSGIMHNDDWVAAAAELKDNFDFVYHNRRKSWDVLRMAKILTHRKPAEQAPSIIDIGGCRSNLLQLLRKLGYSNLSVADLGKEHPQSLSQDRLTPAQGSLYSCPNDQGVPVQLQDMQSTDFPSQAFDVITSVSVIEHGVDCTRFLREANRLLKPGGLLMVSFDLIPNELQHQRILAAHNEAFGVPWTPFSMSQASEFMSDRFALAHGLAALTKHPEQKVVKLFKDGEIMPIEWKGEKYTFGMVSYTKVSDLFRVHLDDVVIDGQPTEIQKHTIETIRAREPHAQISAVVQLTNVKPMFDVPSCMIKVPGVDHVQCTQRQVSNADVLSRQQELGFTRKISDLQPRVTFGKL